MAGYVEMRSLGSARPCADSVRPLSCIHCTFMNALPVSHPHYPTKNANALASLVKGRWLDGKAQALTLCIYLRYAHHFYIANFSAAKTEGLSRHHLLVPAPKIIPCSLSERNCGGVCRNVLALLVSHRAKLGASTITHPCVCGRWGRCIVQRLCSTAIVHPLHVYERSVGFASCETLGVHFIRHPCLTRKLRVLPPAAPKIMPRLLSGVLFLVPMAGVEPARYCYQRILSPSRLPIPSHRLIIMCRKTALYNGNNDFTV